MGLSKGGVGAGGRGVVLVLLDGFDLNGTEVGSSTFEEWIRVGFGDLGNEEGRCRVDLGIDYPRLIIFGRDQMA